MAISLGLIGGAMLAGAAGKAIGGWLQGRGANKQAKTAGKASSAHLDFLEEQRQDAKIATVSGLRDIRRGGESARDALTDHGQGARTALSRGTRGAETRLQQGYGDALGALEAGHQSATSGLMAGGQQAQESYLSGSNAGLDQYRQIAGMGPIDVMQTQAPGRVASMFGQGIGPSRVEQFQQQGVDLNQDPGYQHRLKAGEDAIMRRAAASGGRGGGRTLQALQEHGQSLASQEYGAAYQRQLGTAQAADMAQLQRRQQQIGLGTTADQMMLQQQQELAGRTDKASLFAQDLQAKGLSQMGDALTGQGEFLSEMQYGQAQDLSDLDYKTALLQSGMLKDQGIGLADLSKSEGAGLADLWSSLGSNLATSFQGEGVNLAGTRMQGVGAEGNLTGMAGPSFHAPTQHAGAGSNIAGQVVSNIGGDISQMAMLKAFGLI